MTDASLVLGRLSPETRLAGGLRLDLDAARDAVARFGDALGLGPDEAALGIVEIANSNMARAIRVMTVERGLDPRRFTLLPFGGAGPMHACELADQLGIRSVLVPVAPGVTSALGTLYVDVVHDVSRSRIAPLRALEPDDVDEIFRELEEEARGRLDDDLVPPDRQVLERALDLRYLGQLKSLTIEVPPEPFGAAAVERAHAAFLREYERRFHHVTDEIEVEVSVIRVRGRGLQDRPELPALAPAPRPEPVGTRAVHFAGGAVATAVHARNDLEAGARLDGPLVVEQHDSTTVVPPGWRLEVDERGNLLLSAAGDMP